MTDYKSFLSVSNFDLALTRILTSSNGNYKNFFRHYYASYELARKVNLKYLIAEISSGSYQPSRPRIVYYPKASGVLRPITLLRIEDQIVYQALVNVIANRLSGLQSKFAFYKSFGALFQGPASKYFYYDWHDAYAQFNFAIDVAVSGGQDYFSEFDLVSFYELIDHGILRKIIGQKVNSDELLDLLFKCLSRWTHNKKGELSHGLPQGPAPSAFLAECVLFKMDSLNLSGVTYVRYVDDIRILSSSAGPVRRALIQLDLESKQLGLVPQAQKITAPRKVYSSSEITKDIPSLLLEQDATDSLSQKDVRSLLSKSIEKDAQGWKITNGTHFKYGIARVKPVKVLLPKIRAVALRQPEFAAAIGPFLAKFKNDVAVADIIHYLLDQDPVYDAVASSYIEALDSCEPSKGYAKYRKVISAIEKGSEEKSLLIPLACGTFRGKRVTLQKALDLIEGQKDKIVRSLLLERLFRDNKQASFNVAKCADLLQKMCTDADADVARYAASVLLTAGPPSWTAPKNSAGSVKRLLYGVGKNAVSPALDNVMDVFFKSKMKIPVKMKWKKALGTSLQAIEQRCLRMQALANGDQSARILIVDTFNDALIQCFCPIHPILSGPYAAAAGKKHHPDLGAWLGQANMAAVVPSANKWFLEVHSKRLDCDLAHATHSKGSKVGKHTEPITRAEAEKLMKRAKGAWSQLLTEWASVL